MRNCQAGIAEKGAAPNAPLAVLLSLVITTQRAPHRTVSMRGVGELGLGGSRTRQMAEQGANSPVVTQKEPMAIYLSSKRA